MVAATRAQNSRVTPFSRSARFKALHSAFGVGDCETVPPASPSATDYCRVVIGIAARNIPAYQHRFALRLCSALRRNRHHLRLSCHCPSRLRSGCFLKSPSSLDCTLRQWRTMLGKDPLKSVRTAAFGHLRDKTDIGELGACRRRTDLFRAPVASSAAKTFSPNGDTMCRSLPAIVPAHSSDISICRRLFTG